ncbi:MAG: DNA (cytosine-5-)-methyltransferase [Planctomycetes bacterium GWF2_50_10]|nr:MAG: DNA (cytosine-5-)-methyltransferase [Planctomycetes bacterium GWF2_50_10]
MRTVELFAGAGGLAMGVSRANFQHSAVIEWDKNSCDTIRFNQKHKVKPLYEWPLHECDVRCFDYKSLADKVDLVAGGPPCQPFSLGGKHKGQHDHRDMFPEAVRAVRELRPAAFMFENVKGLLRESFAKYFEYVYLQLSYPDLTLRTGEDWTKHLERLEQYHTKGKHDGLNYRVVFRLLNAADYGVPQKRERVFIIGFRSDLGVEWSFPSATHSRQALLWSKWIIGNYWTTHKISRGNRETPPPGIKERLSGGLFDPLVLPWRTVRDAISDLPRPKTTGDSGVANHILVPGAKQYHGHTGSVLDEPAKTLKAGDHGVPGGENTVITSSGSVRYFTLREAARLQCFPDDYQFCCSWTESMRQMGNAVPVALANVVATHVRSHLERVGRK